MRHARNRDLYGLRLASFPDQAARIADLPDPLFGKPVKYCRSDNPWPKCSRKRTLTDPFNRLIVPVGGLQDGKQKRPDGKFRIKSIFSLFHNRMKSFIAVIVRIGNNYCHPSYRASFQPHLNPLSPFSLCQAKVLCGSYSRSVGR